MRSISANARCGCGTPPAGPQQQYSTRRGGCVLARAQSVTSNCCVEVRQQHLATDTPVSRREAVLFTLVTVLPLQLAAARQASAAEPAAVDNNEANTRIVNLDTLELFENNKQQYRLMVPTSWERKDKAGVSRLGQLSLPPMPFRSLVTCELWRVFTRDKATEQ